MAALKLDQNQAKARFQSFRITLPAASGSQHPGPAVASALRASGPGMARPAASAPPMTIPPAFFLAASSARADVDAQAQWSRDYGDYIDAICKAIDLAHGIWMLTAKLRNVRIDGPIAVGLPGCLDGPELEAHINIFMLGAAAGLRGKGQLATKAIAQGVSKAFKMYQDGVTVPQLPWYPSFALVSGAAAPPTSNVPTPLLSLPSTGLSRLQCTSVVSLMKAGLSGASFPYSSELFTCVADAFEKAVMLWISAQQVTRVMGTGPVPGFRPPLMPGGPVVGGSIIAAPRHFA
jgi:hypothetical protein